MQTSSSRKLRTIAVGWLLFLLATLSYGVSSAAAEQSLRLVWIAREGAALQTQPMRAGAAAAAAEIGARRGQQVELLDWTPQNASAAAQAEALKRAHAEGVSGVLLECEDPLALSPVIDVLAEYGIPVVTFGNDAPQSRRVASCLPDEIELGRTLAKELLQAWGRSRGGVAILAGDMSRSVNLQRLQGVMQVLNEHALPVVGVHPSKEAAIARETLRAVALADRNHAISGWIFLDGWPMERGNPLPWPVGTFVVVAAGELPTYLPYVARDEIISLVAINHFDLGYESMRLLLDALDHAPAARSTASAEIVIISPENLLQRQQLWLDWLQQ